MESIILILFLSQIKKQTCRTSFRGSTNYKIFMKKAIGIVAVSIVGLCGLLFFLLKDTEIIKNIEIKTKQQIEEETKKYAFENSPFYKKYYTSDKLIVLNAWATWCKPCIEEIPLLNQIKTDYSDNEYVVFLSLSTDRDSLKLKPFIDSEKFSFTDISIENFPYRKYILNHLDEKESKPNTSFIKINSKEIPVTYLLKDQEIIYSHIGKLDSAELYNQINNHIKVKE